jgi:hypothetical protein
MDSEVFSEEVDLSARGVHYVAECNGKQISSAESVEELSKKIREYISGQN